MDGRPRCLSASGQPCGLLSSHASLTQTYAFSSPPGHDPMDHYACEPTETQSPPPSRYPRGHDSTLLLLPAPSGRQLASKISCHCPAQSNQHHFQACSPLLSWPSPSRLWAAHEPPTGAGCLPACSPGCGSKAHPGRLLGSLLRSPSCPQSAKSETALPTLRN